MHAPPAEAVAEPAAGGAAEHAPPGAQAADQGVPAAPIFLDSRELAAIRARERLTKGQLHGQARKALNDFANADYAGPVCLEDLFPWKRYVALHDAGEELVGPGISRAILDQFAEVRDPNRQGRPRSDFIFERVDGSAYRVHPGAKPRNDAIPVYCPPSRAPEQTGVCFWHSGKHALPSRTRAGFHKPTSLAKRQHSECFGPARLDSSGGGSLPIWVHTLST